MVRYLMKLAEVSDRVTYEIIAYSHEKRPIVTLTITSPENRARLAEIKAAHLALSDPSSGQKITDGMPVVSWLNYGVHGAEVSSTDAAMPTAYYLAAAQGAAIDKILDNSVILLTASFNPDGSSRQSAWNWMQGAEVPVTDPRSTIHNTFWPGGRTNHYWFDLNRQWLLVQHPGPKGWVAKFHDWKPNMLADFHEMGSNSSYYFHPGAPDRVFPIIPPKSMELLNKVVNGPRAFMDKEKRLYYSEESYDNFYIGKGSTYPHMFGTIGILLEQARTNGLMETAYGILSFRDNIRTHYRNSIALLDSAVDMKGELLAYRQEFAGNTKGLIKQDKNRAYVFSVPGDKAKAYHMIDMMNRHQIRVNRITKDLTIDGKVFRAENSFIVETDQAQYRMVKALFIKLTEFENDTFYDVSAWTLPLAFGVEYAAVTKKSYDLGAVVENSFPTEAAPDKAESGYVFSWTNYYAPRALYRLLDAGINARVATKPFKIMTKSGLRDMGHGSIVVPVGWQGGEGVDKVHDLMATIAAEDGIQVHALNSIHTPMKGMDLGSPNHAEIKKPKILLLMDEGISSSDAGEVWHLLDFRMKIPVVLLAKRNLARTDLGDYSHLVLVNSDRGASNHGDLDEKLTNKISSWVRAGGTLVAHRNGAKWAGEKLLKLSTGLDPKKPKDKNGQISEDPERHNYGDKADIEALNVIGGAIMAGDLDFTHPIGYGYQSRDIATHRNTLIAFTPPENPYATVVKIPDVPLLAGYASKENQDKLKGKASVIAERMGRGAVILFSDNPSFRAYFYGTQKMFLNSLFFSKVFSKPRGK